ncbi:MAG: hypothetical protein KDD82_13185 [Planctomycetes bacterium]|nr:hypothetical protein [Planctomycetota bacterium]
MQPRTLLRAGLRALSKVALAALTLGVLGTCGLRASLSEDAADPAPREAQPLSPEVAARFAYPEAGTPAVEVSRFKVEPGALYTSAWVHLLVTTPGEAQPHTVQVIHYLPAGLQAPAPAVVISPILGGSGELARSAAAAFALRGVHAAIVLKAESYFDATAPPGRLERVLRTAVVDRQRALDWLAGRDDVDPLALGAFGASMGGVITTLLAAVDPRVRVSAIALAGGDLPTIVATSEEPRVARFARELGYGPGRDRAPLIALVRGGLQSDPLDLARAVDPRRVLFVESTADRDMPSAQQTQLYEALGRPARIRIPTGHYAAVAYWPYLVTRVSGFLARELERTPAR